MPDRTHPANSHPPPNEHPPREGWMNYRTATRLEVTDEPGCYVLHTHIYGLIDESVKISLQPPHLIIEGQIEQHDGKYHMGRYVRQVLLNEAINIAAIETNIAANSELIIHIPKQQNSDV